MPTPANVTVTNSVFGPDLAAQLDAQHELGIRHLDLKDALFGKGVIDLSDAEARAIVDQAGERGMDVYCISTVLFDDDAARGERHFAEQHVARIDEALRVARILRPRWIRVMAAQSSGRAEGQPLAEHLETIPWLVDAYREVIARVEAAGFATILENEIDHGILRNPDDVDTLFGRISDAGTVRFTWDVQNLWETGSFPSLEVYERLRPHLGYVHVKGGRMHEGDPTLWKARLRDASWPVAEILRAIAADGASPIICINPCHGEVPPGGYDQRESAIDDIRFVQEVHAHV
jgi:sugar phosphate isomerase/epimerase